jgi:tRNA threonylcarbamoyladenosine biosynthesis protein TsaB
VLTLAVDTATSRGVVGLVDDDILVRGRTWDLATTYSLELLPAIEAVLAEAGVGGTALEAIVIDIGPGGYGALRAGVATAQGLALGLDIPLAGVPRLEADAVPHLGGAAPVVAVHDAGSSGVAWAVYEAGSWPSGLPQELRPPRLSAIEECVEAAPPSALWCGELNDSLRAALDARENGWTEAPAPTKMHPEDAPRALDLVRLARARQAFGDPAAVDVLYLRPPAITRPREDAGAR